MTQKARGLFSTHTCTSLGNAVHVTDHMTVRSPWWLIWGIIKMDWLNKENEVHQVPDQKGQKELALTSFILIGHFGLSRISSVDPNTLQNTGGNSWLRELLLICPWSNSLWLQGDSQRREYPTETMDMASHVLVKKCQGWGLRIEVPFLQHDHHHSQTFTISVKAKSCDC